MMRHGREKKEEFWRNKQNGDFPGKTFLKRDFLPFSTNIYFRENVLKETSYKGQFMEKNLEAFFSFNKGFRCFRKYTRVMKSYKILLIFLQRKLQSFQTKFTKQKSILLFSIRIEFSKQTKFYSNYKKVQCMLIRVGQFASTIKCTHIGFVPGYCLSQILKKSSLQKEMEMTSMRTRALSSQFPVGLRRMTWDPRCLVISAASTY